MRRTTVLLDEGVERELRSAADLKGVPVSVVVREALAEFARKAARRRTRSLMFVAAGRSGHADVAERHEDLLFRGLEPHRSSWKRPVGARRRD